MTRSLHVGLKIQNWKSDKTFKFVLKKKKKLKLTSLPFGGFNISK